MEDEADFAVRAQHNDVMAMPHFTGALGNYAEVGAGIANVFRLFTIEAVWRLTDRDKADITTFGIRVRRFVKL